MLQHRRWIFSRRPNQVSNTECDYTYRSYHSFALNLYLNILFRLIILWQSLEFFFFISSVNKSRINEKINQLKTKLEKGPFKNLCFVYLDFVSCESIWFKIKLQNNPFQSIELSFEANVLKRQLFIWFQYFLIIIIFFSHSTLNGKSYKLKGVLEFKLYFNQSFFFHRKMLIATII